MSLIHAPLCAYDSLRGEVYVTIFGPGDVKWALFLLAGGSKFGILSQAADGGGGENVYCSDGGGRRGGTEHAD